MFRNIFCLLILASFSSCISSLHQLVTYDKVTTDKRVTGRWQQDDNTVFTSEDLLKSNFFKSTNKTSVDGKDTNMGFESQPISVCVN